MMPSGRRGSGDGSIDSVGMLDMASFVYEKKFRRLRCKPRRFRAGCSGGSGQAGGRAGKGWAGEGGKGDGEVRKSEGGEVNSEQDSGRRF